jgi:hypothetical protein
MKKHVILGVHVTDRLKKASDVQKILTAYGCNIRTRIGLHDASETHCSPGGILLLELVGDDKTCNEMVRKLGAVKGVEVKKIVFPH